MGTLMLENIITREGNMLRAYKYNDFSLFTLKKKFLNVAQLLPVTLKNKITGTKA